MDRVLKESIEYQVICLIRPYQNMILKENFIILIDKIQDELREDY